METVHDTDVVCDEIARAGLRATIGKCLMDAADDVPARLRRGPDGDRRRAGAERSLGRRADGRLRVAFAPRFAVSCSRELLEAVAALAAERGLLVHTHASESRGEVDIVRARTGLDNLAYLAATGLVSPRLCAAHCVWVDDTAQGLLADRRQGHALPGHEPEARLGPGARRRAGPPGFTVSLGADGAACNNRLDMFGEMRLAAAASSDPPGTGPADGARRGVDGHARRRPHARPRRRDRRLEVGKTADLIVVGRDAPHAGPLSTLRDPGLCHLGQRRAHPLVDGRVLVDDGRLTGLDPERSRRPRPRTGTATDLRARLG